MSVALELMNMGLIGGDIAVDGVSAGLDAVSVGQGALTNAGIGALMVNSGMFGAAAQLAAAEGALSNAQGAVTVTQSTMSTILGIFSKFKILAMGMLVLILINCVFKFCELIIAIGLWLYDFGPWLFYYFPIWLSKFIVCAIDGLIHLPQCFMWYFLDFAGWVVYLPFRFLFWLLDSIFGLDNTIQNFERDVWCFLGQLDSYIHDPSPAGMGTGFHIIHFPDSVIKTCYSCNPGAMPPCPMINASAFYGFFNCITNPYQGLIGGKFSF